MFESPELLSMTLSLLGADYRVCASFRYQKLPPLPLPIHVFGGRDDEIHPSRLEAWQEESPAYFSWTGLTAAIFFSASNEEAFLSALVKRLAAMRTMLPHNPHAALASA